MRIKPSGLPESSQLPTPLKRSSSWKRRIVQAVFALAVLVGGYFLAMHFGWLSASPETVLQRTFRLANDGKYEEARENLSVGNRNAFHQDPILMKEVFDLITRNQSLVDITPGELKEDGDLGMLTFALTYKDGVKVNSDEFFAWEGGSWRHTVTKTRDVIVRRFGDPIIQKLKPELEKEYTYVEGTGVSLLVPKGSTFDPLKREFDHPISKIFIEVRYKPGQPLASWLAGAEVTWRKPGANLKLKEELPKNSRWKRFFFEGEQLNEVNKAWSQMILIMGDEKEAVTLRAIGPPWESFHAVAKKSLLSAKWEPEKIMP